MENDKSTNEELNESSAADVTEDPEAAAVEIDTKLDNLINTVKSITEPKEPEARADNNLTALKEKITTLEQMIAKMVSSGAYNPARVSPEDVNNNHTAETDFPPDIQVFDNIRDMIIDNNR